MIISVVMICAGSIVISHLRFGRAAGPSGRTPARLGGKLSQLASSSLSIRICQRIGGCGGKKESRAARFRRGLQGGCCQWKMLANLMSVLQIRSARIARFQLEVNADDDDDDDGANGGCATSSPSRGSQVRRRPA